TQNEGVLIYVKDKGNTYLCSDESWHSVKGEDGKNGTNGTNGNDGKNGTNGKNGENGTSCSAKATDGGIQVSCGGTVIGTLTNGKNGDNCSIAEVENGAEVTCGTSKVTIKNGTNGASGSNGTNGTNGDDCTVSKTGGVATVVCGTNSVQISDGTNCSVVESDDGATITCGSNVVTVPKGAQGVAGKSAFDLAKEQDPSLTLANWLASLKGDKGEDGTNCSVSKSGSVTTIDCGNGNTATISDGASGTNGKSAYELANTELTLEAWLASLKGANGSNGTNCSVSKSGSTTTIDCGGGNTATIMDGAPGSSGSKGDTGYGCKVVDDGSGTLSVKCGPDGEPTSTATIYKAVCGTTPYDPAKKFCFNMELNDLCNKEAFDPTKYECVENVLQEKATVAKCGETEYDPETHFCAKFADNTEQVYKYVTVAPEGSEYSKTWMAENLNYETETGSFCYENNDDNCATYGRLYTWATAVGKTEEACGYGKTCNLGTEVIRGVCPDGWHLPSQSEWNELIAAVGDNSGKALKSASGWNNNGNGTDAFGFSALPAGRRYNDVSYYNVGNNAYFWSSSEYGGNSAYYMYLLSDDDRAGLYNYNKNYGLSVRCVQNDPQ
ncbi:MAG: fibrobacter succinogenes major paralogous domain-containing protein, partial [Bacteroidales bacterium]|nr:fibrobacter succinogenes major paralogous domain-containing protein [Bacteroidales bacterium]